MNDIAVHDLEQWALDLKTKCIGAMKSEADLAEAYFNLGDHWNSGESRYGQKVYQAVPEFDRAKKTIQNAAWVSKSIPPENRQAMLGWSHYKVVAKLDEPLQRRLLTQATDESLSVRDLDRLVKEVSPRGESQGKSSQGDSSEPAWEDPGLSKTPYVRDEKLRRAVAEIGECLADTPVCQGSRVIQASHSPDSRDGKATGLKAHDIFCAAICQDCHAEIDNPHHLSREEALDYWNAAYKRTMLRLWQDGVIGRL